MPLNVHSQIIQDQINKLFHTIQKENQEINAVKPPSEDKKNIIPDKLQEFTKLRGRLFFYNYLSSGRGNGPYTELIDDSVKYDLINGIGVNLLGHSHPIYIKSNLEAATSDIMMCGNLLPYKQPIDVSRELIESVSDSRLKHFWFAGSGSFANDSALKIIWQKTAPRYKIIALSKAFAGRSIATQNITFNTSYREGMPKSLEVEYAENYDYKNPENALKLTIDSLNEIWEKDPNGYAALMVELVQGEAGFIYGTEEYYKGIFEWAKNKKLYIFIDEIQTFGRTKELFAYQMFNLGKYIDVLTVGKALQTCGTFYTEELNPKPGLIAGTFVGSISSLNASYQTLKYLRSGNFYGSKGSNAKLENAFTSRLRYLAENSCKDKIGYVGGNGTMISFEVGDSSIDTSKKFLRILFDNGIIAFLAGKDPTRIRFLLPIILSDTQIDDIFHIIEKSALEL